MHKVYPLIVKTRKVTIRKRIICENVLSRKTYLDQFYIENAEVKCK